MWTFPNPQSPPPDREALRERFRKVILGAGYASADGILAEWFDKYMENVPEFVKMLEEYERRQSGRGRDKDFD